MFGFLSVGRSECLQERMSKAGRFLIFNPYSATSSVCWASKSGPDSKRRPLGWDLPLRKPQFSHAHDVGVGMAKDPTWVGTCGKRPPDASSLGVTGVEFGRAGRALPS